MRSLPDAQNDSGLCGGPLGSHLSAYLMRLASEGYKRPTLYPDALLLADLDRWMKRSGLEVKDLSECVLERFLEPIRIISVRKGCTSEQYDG